MTPIRILLLGACLAVATPVAAGIPAMTLPSLDFGTPPAPCLPHDKCTTDR